MSSVSGTRRVMESVWVVYSCAVEKRHDLPRPLSVDVL